MFGVSADMLQIEVYGIGQCDLLGTRRRFVVPFPQSQNQRLDRLPFLDVEQAILRIKRVESNRFGIRVSKVYPVFTPSLAVDQLAEPFIGVSRIHQHNMSSLFPILPDHVVRKKAFA